VTADQNQIRFAFGHAGGDGAHAHLRDQFHADVGACVGVLQFEDELRGYEEGAFDYITKPFHPLSLAPTIRETLEAQTQRDLEGKRQNRIEKLRSLLNLRGSGEVSQRS